MTACAIKDSGERRDFGTGAVRDISDGKGRCDLMPLGMCALIIKNEDFASILCQIENFKTSKNPVDLGMAIAILSDILGVPIQTILLDAAKHYEDGAKKYGENNWQKGIPLHCYIDSGVRHLLKFYRGDKDEPHDRAFVWNMLGAMWTIVNKPEMDDLIPT